MINIKHIASEIGIDTKTLLQLFELFIDQTAVDLQKIRSAIKEKNWDTLKRSAHSIKGAALNLELEKIAGEAKELELKTGEGQTEALLPHITTLENLFAVFKKELSKENREAAGG